MSRRFPVHAGDKLIDTLQFGAMLDRQERPRTATGFGKNRQGRSAMIDRRVTQSGWNRRDFLKSSAAAAASVYAMRWGGVLAAEVPLEFDGAKFDLMAAEPNPK